MIDLTPLPDPESRRARRRARADAEADQHRGRTARRIGAAFAVGRLFSG